MNPWMFFGLWNRSNNKIWLESRDQFIFESRVHFGIQRRHGMASRNDRQIGGQRIGIVEWKEKTPGLLAKAKCLGKPTDAIQ